MYASVTAGGARQSSARRRMPQTGAQRTDAPYPRPLTHYLSILIPSGFCENLIYSLENVPISSNMLFGLLPKLSFSGLTRSTG